MKQESPVCSSYDAFISYRHMDLDLDVAEKLHRLLESFHVPKGIRKKSGKSKINRVFRDKEELPISSNLAENIFEALKASEYLIVICSPDTPHSEWVQKEIETYIELHGRERILTVLTAGEPSEAFPEILCHEERQTAGGAVERVEIEPLAADIRGSSRHAVHKNLKREFLRIAAPLLSCTYDDLKQRRRERRIKRTAAAFAASSLFFLGFGAYSAWQSVQIQTNYKKQLINQSRYLAETSSRLLESGDRMNAVLVALEALPTNSQPDRPYITEAEYALNRALNTYESGVDLKADQAMKHHLFVRDIALSRSGKRLLSFDALTAAYVWDTESARLLYSLKPGSNEDNTCEAFQGGFLPDDDTLLLYSSDRILCIRISDGAILWKKLLETTGSYGAISPDYSRLVLYNSEEAELLDAGTGKRIALLTNDGDSFPLTGGGIFSDDNRHLAIPCYSDRRTDATGGGIFLADLEKGTSSYVSVEGNNISSLLFYDDDTLIGAYSASDYQPEDLYSQAAGTIAAYSLSKDRLLWSVPYEHQQSMNFSPPRLKRHLWKEGEEPKALLVYTVDNKIVSLNPVNGSTLFSFVAPAKIQNVMFASSSGLSIAVDQLGTISFADLAAGKIYSDLSFQVNYNVRYADFRPGVLVLSPYQSKNVISYRYVTGAGYEEGKTVDGTISSGSYSPSGLRAAIYSQTESGGQLKVIDAQKKELYTLTFDSEVVQYWFCGEEDSLLLIALSDGHIGLYDSRTGGKKKEYNEEDPFSRIIKSPDNSILLLAGYSSCRLLETKSLDVIFQWDNDTDFPDSFYAISNDGHTLFCGKENRLVLYRIDGSGQGNPEMLSSEEAVCGSDSKIRLLDLASLKVLRALELPCQSSASILFSPDDSLLYTQGDDGVLRIYDTASGALVKEDTQPTEKIIGWKFYDRRPLLAMRTYYGTVLLDTKSHAPVANIKDCLDVRPDVGQVLIKSGSQSYGFFPYFTLKDLLEEAQKQTKGLALTPAERTAYHID